MTFGYVQPFSFQIGAPSAIKVAGVRHGITEITLGDGRLVRATLHINDVKPSAERPGGLDVSYNVITEVTAKPSVAYRFANRFAPLRSIECQMITSLLDLY
jgi:hypothetical protein